MNGNNTPANRMPAISNSGSLARLEAETGSLARKVLWLEECLQNAFQYIGALQEQLTNIMAGMANADKQMPGIWMPPKEEEKPGSVATTAEPAHDNHPA